MLIELYRKLTADAADADICGICGNDFELGSDFPMAHGDAGEEGGALCPTCLEYLNRRKGDAEDPTLGNWPACGWPTTEVLQRLQLRYPEAMFGTEEELLETAVDRAGDERFYEASVVWRMEREYELT